MERINPFPTLIIEPKKHHSRKSCGAFAYGGLEEIRLIKVVTSVCTGDSNMPPAYCILDLRISSA